MLFILPWGSGPGGPGKKIQRIARPTTQPVCPSSRPRIYPSPERSSMPWTMLVQSRFPLKGTHLASSSWLESFRVTDKELGNHTLEMILWSMILMVFKNLHTGSLPTDDL